MKNSMAVLLLIGAISNPSSLQQAQAVSTGGFLQADAKTVQEDANTKKPVEAKATPAADAKKVDSKASVKSAKAPESKPPLSEKVQVTEQMDIKGGNHLVVQVEAVKKPQNANKL